MNDCPRPDPPRMRPPAPAWMWLAFTLGPALGCLLAAGVRTGAPAGAAVKDGLAGLALGLLLGGGLALAERFFAGRLARVFGGLAFAALLAVGGAAVGFAGCIPYPDVHTEPARRAAAVPPGSPSARSNGSPTPQPSPKTVVEMHWFPIN